MIRFDYKISENLPIVYVTLISEEENKHGMAGKLVLTNTEFYNLKDACELWDKSLKLNTFEDDFFRFEKK
jgi:hypothetical protein